MLVKPVKEKMHITQTLNIADKHSIASDLLPNSSVSCSPLFCRLSDVLYIVSKCHKSIGSLEILLET